MSNDTPEQVIEDIERVLDLVITGMDLATERVVPKLAQLLESTSNLTHAVLDMESQIETLIERM